jgi:calcineurin-like phosphoesterase family protein
MITYFTSDTHFFHSKIIEYANRPFKTVLEMNERIFKNINERVDKHDLLIHLGDVCFKRGDKEAPESVNNVFEYCRDRINCKNIIFCAGNHDGKRNGVKTPLESMIIKMGGTRIFLTHDPKFAKKDYEFNFCGHWHGNNGKFTRLGNDSYIIDVGVDAWDYQPITFNEIDAAYQQWRKGGYKSEKLFHRNI